MLADFGWETAKPEPTQLQRTRGTEPEEKSAGHNLWKKQDFPAFGRGRENRMPSPLEVRSESFLGAVPLKIAGHPRALHSGEAGVEERSYAAAAQWPEARSSLPRGPQPQSTSYTFKQNPCPLKAPEKTAAPTEGKRIGFSAQKRPADQQVKLGGKDSSLRVISAVIESMKHWCQYADKTPLLFEVLGVLDSAVTPGAYGGKTFLLRDGQESVPCVFYEIDRELPRLIRGRVHRCVGNYDAARKVFKCVSVRPATVPEQQTFQDFVRAADTEMGKYVKTSNEV